MIVQTDTLDGVYTPTGVAADYLKKYEKAKSVRENFVSLFEETLHLPRFL